MKNLFFIFIQCLATFAIAQNDYLIERIQTPDNSYWFVNTKTNDTIAHYWLSNENSEHDLCTARDYNTQKTGIIDRWGRVLIPVLYDEVYLSTNYLIQATKNGKKGLLNLKNEIIIPFEYDDLEFSGLFQYSLGKNIPNFLKTIEKFSNFEPNWQVIKARKGNTYYFINFKNEVLKQLPNHYHDTVTIGKVNYVYQNSKNDYSFFLRPLIAPWQYDKLINAKIKNDSLGLTDLNGKRHYFADTMYYYINDSIMAIGNLTDGHRLCDANFKPFTPYYKEIYPVFEEGSYVGGLYSNTPKPAGYNPKDTTIKYDPRPYDHQPGSRIGRYRPRYGHSVLPYNIDQPFLRYFVIKKGSETTYLTPDGKPYTLPTPFVPSYERAIDKKITDTYTHFITLSNYGLIALNERKGIVLDSARHIVDSFTTTKKDMNALEFGDVEPKEVLNIWLQRTSINKNPNYAQIKYINESYWRAEKITGNYVLLDKTGNLALPDTYSGFQYDKTAQLLIGTQSLPNGSAKYSYWSCRNNRLEPLSNVNYAQVINQNFVMAYYYEKTRVYYGIIDLRKADLNADTSKYWNTRPIEKGCIVYYDATLRYGVFDADLNEIVPTIYDKISHFQDNNLAKVRKDGQFGYINTAGKVVVPLMYDAIFPLNFQSAVPLKQPVPRGLYKGKWEVIVWD